MCEYPHCFEIGLVVRTWVDWGMLGGVVSGGSR